MAAAAAQQLMLLLWATGVTVWTMFTGAIPVLQSSFPVSAGIGRADQSDDHWNRAEIPITCPAASSGSSASVPSAAPHEPGPAILRLNA
jgi:hypothetical protein